MESLKKVISLNQAAKYSGYSQDYLGFLIRTGEIKAVKKGRSWLTTEEEIKNYILKKKLRNNQFAFRDFFSNKRIKNIILATIALIVIFWLFFNVINFTKNDNSENLPKTNPEGDILSYRN